MTDVPLFPDLPAGPQPEPLPADEQKWPYAPARVRAVADYLRPLLRAGVSPLDAASGVLDVDAEASDVQALSDAEQTAKWLAEASAHPRFSGERWRMLLESDGNVTFAHAQARQRVSLPTPENVAVIDGARDFLLRWHRER